jgi:hypothetical protein
MRTVVLAVISLVVASACASRAAIQPLQYSIDNGALTFERYGAIYVVTDDAIVAEADEIASELDHAQRALEEASKPVGYGIAPLSAPNNAQMPDPRYPGQFDSLSFTNGMAEVQAKLLRLKDDVTSASRHMSMLFDDAVALDTAHRVGSAYEFHDSRFAALVQEQENRVAQAERKLGELAAVQTGLNSWAANQQHAQVEPGPLNDRDDPFAPGNRPSVSFRGPSDSSDLRTLQNALRHESLKLARLLEEGVRDGRATRKSIAMNTGRIEE